MSTKAEEGNGTGGSLARASDLGPLQKVPKKDSIKITLPLP